jgi:Leucine-rich repeat (LRR) protein
MARKKADRDVERKIEEARQSGLDRLDLSGENLTEWPEALGALTQLQSLDLSFNKLGALPESLALLTQLQSLDLSNNQLTNCRWRWGRFINCII